MDKRPLKAIHFDLDGVIADSEHLHEAAERQTCRDHGLKVDEVDWNQFRGRTSNDIFTSLISKYSDTEAHKSQHFVDHKIDIFLKTAKKELKPIDGAKEFLDWSRKYFEKVSLVTSSIKTIQSFTVEHFGLSGHFDAVINGDDISEGKPSPQPYQKILAKLGLDGGESIVIEDSINGILSAKAAGCKVLGITTSHTAQELAVAKPDYIADNYIHARQLISRY